MHARGVDYIILSVIPVSFVLQTKQALAARRGAPAGFTVSDGEEHGGGGDVDASRPPDDPLLERFVRLADMLDRPDGVDEAVRAVLTIPSFLNRSAVLDERCPFDRLVDDDEQLVTSIVRRLRCLHGFRSGYPGLVGPD